MMSSSLKSRVQEKNEEEGALAGVESRMGQLISLMPRRRRDAAFKVLEKRQVVILFMDFVGVQIWRV